MKYILIGILAFCVSQSVQAEDLGKPVKIYRDARGPQFGSQYAYDSDKFWSLTVSLWAGDLLPDFQMKTLAWRLFDSSTQKYVNHWTTAVNHQSSIMYPGSMVYSWILVDENETRDAIKSLPNLKVVLSVDRDLAAPVPTHFIDLGSYCLTDPKHFMNLTSGSSGCKAD